MKYHLMFFPFVGTVLGILEWLWYAVCIRYGIGQTAFALIAMVLIIIVTGGLHFDGYMDTCDAIHSFRDKKKKLEILKDPHIGAFSVICLLGLLMVDVASAAEILNTQQSVYWICLCASFTLSRAITGIAVLMIPPSKNDGMLRSETDTSNRKAVLAVLIAELLIVISFIFWNFAVMSVAIVAAQALILFWFKKMCLREFGGISGDLAGYLVCISEMTSFVIVAVFSVVM